MYYVYVNNSMPNNRISPRSSSSHHDPTHSPGTLAASRSSFSRNKRRNSIILSSGTGTASGFLDILNGAMYCGCYHWIIIVIECDDYIQGQITDPHGLNWINLQYNTLWGVYFGREGEINRAATTGSCTGRIKSTTDHRWVFVII